MPQQLVEGWTERVETQLLADGRPFDLTGYDRGGSPVPLVMRLFAKSGKEVAFEGQVGIEPEEITTGVVYFDPAPGDLKAGSYTVRWQLTDSAGKVAFFPNGDPETWEVLSVSGV